jgi:hypothetical protein
MLLSSLLVLVLICTLIAKISIALSLTVGVALFCILSHVFRNSKNDEATNLGWAYLFLFIIGIVAQF